MWQIIPLSCFEDRKLQTPWRIVEIFTTSFSKTSARIYWAAKTPTTAVNSHYGWDSISGWICCLLSCCWPSSSLTSLKRWITSRLQPSLRFACFPRWWSWKCRGWNLWLQTGLFTAPWRWKEARNSRLTKQRHPSQRECAHADMSLPCVFKSACGICWE